MVPIKSNEPINFFNTNQDLNFSILTLTCG